LVPVGFQGRGLPLLGDADTDGSLDGDDWLALANHFGTTGGKATWSQGDFDHNGLVNTHDWNLLAMHFDLHVDPAAIPSPSDWLALEAMVPEPVYSGLIQMLVAAAGRRHARTMPNWDR
jgi:hypothetical protein